MARRPSPRTFSIALRVSAGAAVLVGCLSRLEPDALEQGALENADAASDADEGRAPDGGEGDAEARPRTLVIRQIYAGGGLPDAVLQQDIVELFNASNAPRSLEGLSLQMAGPEGAFAVPVVRLPAIVVPPGKYVTVAFGASTDAAGAPVDSDLALSRVRLPEGAGKIALVQGLTALGCGTVEDPCDADRIVDLVGYGEGVSAYEGSGAAPAISVALAVLRRDEGCTDTDDNRDDFVADEPRPRNLQSEAHACEPSDAGLASDAAPGPREAGPREAGPREAGPREVEREAGPRDASPRLPSAPEDRRSSPSADEDEDDEGDTLSVEPSRASAGCAFAPAGSPVSAAGGLITALSALGCAMRRGSSRRRYEDPNDKEHRTS